MSDGKYDFNRVEDHWDYYCNNGYHHSVVNLVPELQSEDQV